MFGTPVHLVARFFTSVVARPLSPREKAWVDAQLSPAERTLWEMMSRADQRHGFSVANRVQSQLRSEATREVLAAALLHDVGKAVARIGPFRLGPLGRSVATVFAMTRFHPEFVRTYIRHHEIGAQMLAEAESASLVVAWAREHELPRSEWTIPAQIAAALDLADNG